MPRGKPVAPYVGQPKHYAMCPYCCVQGDELRAEIERRQKALDDSIACLADERVKIERLRAALEEVKSYGHWSDCPAGASDNYRCRCPYGDLSEALGRDTEC